MQVTTEIRRRVVLKFSLVTAELEQLVKFCLTTYPQGRRRKKIMIMIRIRIRIRMTYYVIFILMQDITK